MQCDDKLFICVTEAGPNSFHIEVADDLWNVIEDAGCCNASELNNVKVRLKKKWKIE